jgi:hypothetical protein
MSPLSPSDAPSIGDLQAALASVRRPGGPGCPPQASLWGALEGSLPAAEAEALAIHAGTCAECDEALALGRELLREREALGGPAPARLHRRASPARWLWAGGGALLAAASLLVWFRPAPREESPLRAGPPAAVVRALAGEGRQQRERLLLRWSGITGARYSVKLVTEDLTPLLQMGGLQEPELAVPAAALRSLPRGARLFWMVTAHLPGGGAVSSPAFRLEVE